jgi:hypothetical protein
MTLSRRLRAESRATVFDRAALRLPSTRLTLLVALPALLIVTAAFTHLASGARAHLGTTSVPCARGRSYAGWELTSPHRLYDGVTATITPDRRISGISGPEHIGAVVGVGEGQRLWVAADLAGYQNGDWYAYAYEFGNPGNHFFQVLKREYPVHWRESHQVSVRRVSGRLWSIEVDGRRVAPLVDLPGSAAGLPYPHTFLSSTNLTAPCNNVGGAVFTKVGVLKHNAHLWTTFPAATKMLAWPGYSLRLLGPDSFAASNI